MPTMPNRQHYFLARSKCVPLQEVSDRLILTLRLVANSCWLSQEEERPSSLLEPPGEERVTEALPRSDSFVPGFA